MRKVECLVPSVSSITGFQTALTSNKFFILLVLIIAFTAGCFVPSQYIFPAFFFLVCPCCNDVSRLIVLHKTSIQQSTISSYQYISKCTAPVLTEYTCNIYLILRTKSWLEDVYDDEQMQRTRMSIYICQVSIHGERVHNSWRLYFPLWFADLWILKNMYETNSECHLHRITAVIPA